MSDQIPADRETAEDALSNFREFCKRGTETAATLIRLNDAPAPNHTVSEVERWQQRYGEHYARLEKAGTLIDERGETAPHPDTVRASISEIVSAARMVQRTGKERLTSDIALNIAEHIGGHIQFSHSILERGDFAKKGIHEPAVSVVMHAAHIISRDAMNDGPTRAHMHENHIGGSFGTESQNLVFVMHSLATAATHPGPQFKNGSLQLRP